MSKKQNTLDREVREMTLKLLESLDTPIALSVAILMRYEEWEQIARKSVSPGHYIDSFIGAHRFKRDLQACEILRKYQGLPCDIDTKQVAIDGFWAAEAQCYKTNLRLDRFICSESLPRVILDDSDERLFDFIRKVRKEVRDVLGPVPQHIDPSFGPGAVFESKGHRHARRLTLGDKMQMTPAVTREASDVFYHYFWASAWGRERVRTGFSNKSPYAKVVRGNRFATVEKDATKDRAIGIEPGANVWLQLGVGAYIRRRLQKMRGYLLCCGKSERYHQALALEGSRSGKYATIDLSSASDTVCKALVKLLLPADWFDLLDALRSPMTQVNGKWVLLEKFSSMGNGFTFELETLIFAAIAQVICGDDGWDVTVYGDDIIVPSAHASGVVAALRYFGFTPNPRKTFISGPFRESCGGDFFDGVGVRPYYLKEVPHEARHWIGIANGLYRASGFCAHARSSPYYRARFFALGQLPKQIRECIGPVQLGDILIHDRESRWRFTRRDSIRWFKVWRPVARMFNHDLGRWVDKRVKIRVFSPEVQLALALYGAPDTGNHGNGSPFLVPRNGVAGYRFGRVRFS